MSTLPQTPRTPKLTKQSSTLTFNFEAPKHLNSMIKKHKSAHESKGIFHQKQPYAVEVFDKNQKENPHAIIHFPNAVQLDFRRKMYSVLFLEFLSTLLFSLLFYYLFNAFFVISLTLLNKIIVSCISSVVSLITFGVLYWKRESYPINYIGLLLFSFVKGITVAIICYLFANYELLVVIGTLTVINFISGLLNLVILDKDTPMERLMKPRNASGLAWAIYSLCLFIVFHAVDIPSFPINAIFRNFVFVTLTTLWFSYDTHLLMKKITVDEYMLGVIYLYSDIFVLLLLLLMMCAASESSNGIPIDVVPDMTFNETESNQMHKKSLVKPIET